MKIIKKIDWKIIVMLLIFVSFCFIRSKAQNESAPISFYNTSPSEQKEDKKKKLPTALFRVGPVVGANVHLFPSNEGFDERLQTFVKYPSVNTESAFYGIQATLAHNQWLFIVQGSYNPINPPYGGPKYTGFNGSVYAGGTLERNLGLYLLVGGGISSYRTDNLSSVGWEGLINRPRDEMLNVNTSAVYVEIGMRIHAAPHLLKFNDFQVEGGVNTLWNVKAGGSFLTIRPYMGVSYTLFTQR